MSGRYLPDTNVAIRVLNQEVDLEARRGSGLEAFLCLTVAGELLFGAAKSRQSEANRARVDRLIELCPLVPQDLGTAHRYGTLKAELRKKGRPIPENDLWIAACALQHELVVATLDRTATSTKSMASGSRPGRRGVPPAPACWAAVVGASHLVRRPTPALERWPVVYHVRPEGDGGRPCFPAAGMFRVASGSSSCLSRCLSGRRVE